MGGHTPTWNEDLTQVAVGDGRKKWRLDTVQSHADNTIMLNHIMRYRICNECKKGRCGRCAGEKSTGGSERG